MAYIQGAQIAAPTGDPVTITLTGVAAGNLLFLGVGVVSTIASVVDAAAPATGWGPLLGQQRDRLVGV